MAPICQGPPSTTTAASTTGATTETAECPDGWATYTDAGSVTKCFKYFSDEQYATNAEESCRALGGHLASIHSIEEHNFIVQMVSADDFWVGGVDFNHNGAWGWTDGSNFDFSHWNPGQPGGGEYYLIIAGPLLDWRDWDNEHYRTYICQLIM